MKRFNYSKLKDKLWDIKIINYLTQIQLKDINYIK